jgi:hypothetical protein
LLYYLEWGFCSYTTQSSTPIAHQVVQTGVLSTLNSLQSAAVSISAAEVQQHAIRAMRFITAAVEVRILRALPPQRYAPLAIETTL